MQVGPVRRSKTLRAAPDSAAIHFALLERLGYRDMATPLSRSGTL